MVVLCMSTSWSTTISCFAKSRAIALLCSPAIRVAFLAYLVPPSILFIRDEIIIRAPLHKVA